MSAHEARKFADKYASITSEKQFDQSYWRDMFTHVCGIDDLLSTGIEFQYPVRSKETGTIKFIDALWPSVVLVEHKSAGEDLDKAYKQATEYWISLDQKLRTPYIILSDFARIRIVEVETEETFEFLLTDLPQHLDRIEAVIGNNASNAARVQVEADTKAAELMGELFTQFEKAGFTGHATSVFLIRILFLMFGDDTRMWRKTDLGLFGDIVAASSENGQGLGAAIQELFEVLNTPKDKRPGTLPPTLGEFPYVNGGIFAESLPLFHFTKDMRKALLTACHYNWSTINPTIFGSLFQSVRDKETRRVMGEHYTSEQNILRTINDLFLNDFHSSMLAAWDSPQTLRKFQRSLADYRWLDAAAGSGNFLCVAYRRMRDIELRCIARLQELEGRQGDLQLDGTLGLSVHLGQFAGIEIDEWSASIARVAMWLTDHQANLALEEVNGSAPNRFPLTESANIVCANALRIDWTTVVEPGPKTFIMGNPPFYGSTWQTDEQKADTAAVWGDVRGSGQIDFVANWHLLAARMMAAHGGSAALVSTNSITQGEQPAVLWGELSRLGMSIDFAHRTFAWQNDAAGQAAVHVVIIGFSAKKNKGKKPLWEYPNPKGQPVLREVANINAYLLPAPDVLITARTKPLSTGTPIMDNGSKPTDAGHLSDISVEEAQQIRDTDPIAAKYLRRIVGAKELIQGIERWCLWLPEVSPSEIRTSPVLHDRVAAVKQMRAASKDKQTKKDADRPWEFQKIRQPSKRYIALPLTSSEDREYVPMEYFDPDIIVNNAVSVVSNAPLWMFGLLSAKPMNVWNRAVSGRLESRLRFSNSITYNNFPFTDLSTEQITAIEAASQRVLDARAAHPTQTLADLYGSSSMPSNLRDAHHALDKAVLASMGLPAAASDEKILAALFEEYLKQTEGLTYTEPKKRKAKATSE